MLLATSGPYTPRTFSVLPSGGLIGRSRKCQISLLHDCEVSHNHAVIEPAQGGTLCIRDVGSTFGTYLNDKRVRCHEWPGGSG
jgi:pSer/pThr/pTyr-binding forkhead associated (FHA) protein